MRWRSLGMLLAVATLTSVRAASGQDVRPRVPRDTNLTHVLYLADGSTLVGRLIQRDATSIVFETNGGTLTVPASRVKELREVRPTEIKGNEYWFPDANETRLFFAPTGRMLKMNEGYYSNTYLFLQNFAGGVSDQVTLAGGFSLLPTGNFFEQNVYYLAPKLGLYNSEKTNVAVGALAGLVPGNGYNQNTDFGIAYAVATRGAPDASVTAGVGYGFSEGRLHQRPLFMVGGATRASRRVALVTENYVWSTREPRYTTCGGYSCYAGDDRMAVHALFSYGLRFMGEKISTDFALWKLAEDGFWPGVPYVAFAVKF